MEALILSCGTGGGHFGAAEAIREEMERRGHRATVLDPYSLTGKKTDKKVGNVYVRTVQKAPGVFGFLYFLGELYRHLPIHSPVQWVNNLMVEPFKKYLDENHFDVIICPHLFPAEILTCMKKQGISLPPTIFVGTDYACIPFTEETDLDYYVVPSKRLIPEYVRRGIKKEKIRAFGIPVRRTFREKKSREAAAKSLGLDPSRHYILMAGGSIGAGKIPAAAKALEGYLNEHEDTTLVIICGSNRALLRKMIRRYKKAAQVKLIEKTKKIADYMRLCDVLISKPGGLSSTEAAVLGIPLIHTAPIPGCESSNMKFFSRQGMSVGIGKNLGRLPEAIDSFKSEQAAGHMRDRQRHGCNANATPDICSFAESIISR